MKLRGEIELHVKGEPVLRSPNVLDKLVRAFGGEPDLRTASVRASLEAATVVEAARSALARLGATNAVTLVIDDQVLFWDREGRKDDLGDLYLAFHGQASVFGKDFSTLRLAVEHEEAGLHIVLEVQARSVLPEGEPAARVVVSGRVKAFEPLPGEDAEAYRLRVEPLTLDPGTYEVHRRQFESYVSRVADAMRAALPESRVEVAEAEALVQKPERGARAAAAPPPPDSPRYDPYERYYPNPFGGLLTAMMWGSLFMMAMPPHVTVIDGRGEVLGSPDEVGPADADGSFDEGSFDDGGVDDGGFDGGDFDGGGFDGGGFD